MTERELDAFKTIKKPPQMPNTLNLRLDPNNPVNSNVNIYDKMFI